MTEPHRNGVYHEPKGKLRDGYEGCVDPGWKAIRTMRAQIASAREVERLRESIHRCDEGAIR